MNNTGATSAQQQKEIGIRIAMGADRRLIMRLVVGAGVRLALVGIVLGVGASVASARYMSALLFGFSPSDPLTWTATVLVLLCAAVCASFLPALRAAGSSAH